MQDLEQPEVNGCTQLDSLPDNALLTHYVRHSCPRSFEAIYDRFQGPIYGFLRKYLYDPSYAEDLLQQVFMRLHCHDHQSSPIPHIRHWLLLVASNLAKDHMKIASRRPAVLMSTLAAKSDGDSLEQQFASESELDPADVHALRDDASRIWGMIEQRNPKWFATMKLVYQDGLTWQEAASVLGVPHGTVCIQIHRCIAFIRQELGVLDAPAEAA